MTAFHRESSIADIETPAEPVSSRDRLGGAIRAVARSRGVVVGLMVGFASVAAAGGVVVLLGLIPADSLRVALGVSFPGEPTDAGARVARGFLSPWLGQETFRAEGSEFSFRALFPLPTLLLVLLLTLAGLGVRRLLPTPRARSIALVTAAITAAALLSMLAATLGFDLREGEESYEVTFDSGAYFFAGAIELLVVGVFSFGVVSLWREPFRTPARIAATLFAVVLFAGIVLFPFWIVAHDPPGRQDTAAVQDLASVSFWGPGMATAALPLALGAEAHLETEEFFSPFVSSVDAESDFYEYLPGLARYAKDNDDARLGGYAGAGKIGWKIFVILGAVLLILLWALAAVRAVRRLGAPRAVDGLRTGALVGLFGGLLVVSTSPLAPVVVEGVGSEVYWGVTVGAALQTAVTLLALTALSGAVYAALRPAPTRYSLQPLAVPGWLWPAEATPEPAGPQPEARGRYCERCGTRFETEDAAFCGSCGTPRNT